MRYFDEIEKSKKEANLSKHPRFLQSLFNSLSSVHDYYDECLGPLIRKDTKVLDAGCGKKGIMNKYKGMTACTVGMDMQLSALKRNTAMDYKIVSSVYSLPFREETFDVIISQWVVEHLSEPKMAFSEFKRVLKDNGSLILVTNSVYNPLMFFNAVMPEGIRDRIKKRALPPEIEEDTFPTYYKCNSVGKLDKALRDFGFEKRFAGYVGDPSFFVFSKFLFPLTMVYELATSFRILRPLKMHVVVHYVKRDKR